jgi:hypothetical protein
MCAFLRWPFLTVEQRVSRLEDELYLARQAVRSLLPDDVNARFSSYYDCDDRRAAHQWEHDLIDYVIGRAQPLTRDEGSYFGLRGYCPLCGNGSTSPYDRGFALPEGLSRHLSGAGNTGRCAVFETLLSQARDYWEPRFQEIEAAEKALRDAETERRRRTELLYRVSPDSPPRLIDEGAYGDHPRDGESLAWAQERLQSLGFISAHADRVCSYTFARDEYIVFADPRVKGKLVFEVHPSNPRKRARRGSARPRMQRFELPDSWKNDLTGKFNQRLMSAIETLEPKARHAFGAR